MSNDKEQQASASDCPDSEIEEPGTNKIELEPQRPITPRTHYTSELDEEITSAQVPKRNKRRVKETPKTDSTTPTKKRKNTEDSTDGIVHRNIFTFISILIKLSTLYSSSTECLNYLISLVTKVKKSAQPYLLKIFQLLLADVIHSDSTTK